MSTLLSLLGILLTAFLPLLVKWLGGRMENGVNESLAFQREILQELAVAVDHGSARDVAAAWARHDAMLLQIGVHSSGPDLRGPVGDPTERRRELHRQRVLDAAAARIRTKPADRTPTLPGGIEPLPD